MSSEEPPSGFVSPPVRIGAFRRGGCRLEAAGPCRLPRPPLEGQHGQECSCGCCLGDWMLTAAVVVVGRQRERMEVVAREAASRREVTMDNAHSKDCVAAS